MKKTSLKKMLIITYAAIALIVAAVVSGNLLHPFLDRYGIQQL